MSVTYGFYNSLNGDRKYDATQISSIFDGLIVDGVFASVGTCFVTTADGESSNVNVGIGRAWFNSTWILNDAVMSMAAPESNALLDRIDALVIEIDSSEEVRANSIKFIQGVAATEPVRPGLKSETTLHQYPICYITRKSASTVINQEDITNMIGSEATPFVTGLLQTVSITELIGQWEDSLDQFVKNETGEFSDWMVNEQAIYTSWFNALKADLTSEQKYLDDWINSEQTDFVAWFNEVKGQLSTDAAGNLQNQMDATKEYVANKLSDYWVHDLDFVSKTTVFNSDGSIEETDENENVRLTVFNGDGTITETYTSGEITYTKTTTFNSDGSISEVAVV